MTGCCGWRSNGVPAGSVVRIDQVQPLVVLDIDWRTLATQDFQAGGDGPYTVAGLAAVVAGTGQSNTFGIVNGTGLRYNANTTAANAYGSGTRSATNIAFALTELALWDVRYVYLLEMFLSSITQPTSGDQVHIGLLLDTAGTDRYLAAMRRNSAGNAQLAMQADTTVNGDAKTNDTIAFRVDGRGGWGCGADYDTVADAFPSQYFDEGGTQPLPASFNGPFDTAQSDFVHAFVNGSNAGTHDITIARTRITRIG